MTDPQVWQRKQQNAQHVRNQPLPAKALGAPDGRASGVQSARSLLCARRATPVHAVPVRRAVQLGRDLLPGALARVPRLPSRAPRLDRARDRGRGRARRAFQPLGEVMEEVLHRARLSPWIRDALPELRGLHLALHEPPRGRLACQSALGGEAGPVFVTADAA